MQGAAETLDIAKVVESQPSLLLHDGSSQDSVVGLLTAMQPIHPVLPVETCPQPALLQCRRDGALAWPHLGKLHGIPGSSSLQSIGSSMGMRMSASGRQMIWS